MSGSSSRYKRGKKCHSCGRGPVHDTSPYVLSIPCLVILLILLYVFVYFLESKCSARRTHWDHASGLISGTMAAVVVLIVVHAAHYCPF